MRTTEGGGPTSHVECPCDLLIVPRWPPHLQVVSLHCNLDDQTRHLINAERCVPPQGCLLLCCSRSCPRRGRCRCSLHPYTGNTQPKIYCLPAG